MRRDSVCMKSGKASIGQTNPAAKTMGREEKRTTGVAISLALNRLPKKSPKERHASKNAKEKVSKSVMFASLVTSKYSKL